MYSDKWIVINFHPPLSSPRETYITLIFYLLLQRENYKLQITSVLRILSSWFSSRISFWHMMNSSSWMVTGIRPSGSPLRSSVTEICYCLFEILALKPCSMLKVCDSWPDMWNFSSSSSCMWREILLYLRSLLDRFLLWLLI